MHDLLCIDEIVVRIVHSLLFPSGSGTPTTYTNSWAKPAKDTQSALLALALSCKTLSEAALDGLWRTQTSIAPLLRLLSTVKEREVLDCEKDPHFPMDSILVRDSLVMPRIVLTSCSSSIRQEHFYRQT